VCARERVRESFQISTVEIPAEAQGCTSHPDHQGDILASGRSFVSGRDWRGQAVAMCIHKAAGVSALEKT